MVDKNPYEFGFGEHCRALCGAPARYFYAGYCLFVSAQDNDFKVSPAFIGDGKECGLPLPSDGELKAAKLGYIVALHD